MTGNFYECLVQRGVDLKEFVEASGDMLKNVDYSGIRPVAGIISVVEELSKNNILLAISSNGSGTIREVLTRFNFAQYFREILGSDFMLSKKDKIIYAANKYQVAPAEYLLYRRYNRRY